MIEVYVSGNAASALVEDGTTLLFAQFDDDSIRPIDRGQAHRWMASNADLEHHSIGDVDEVWPKLNEAYARDRSMQLFDLALSTKLPQEIREDAAGHFEELVQKHNLEKFVENIVLAMPNEKLATKADTAEFENFNFLSELLKKAIEFQPQIALCYEALNKTLHEHGDAPKDNERFKCKAISEGVFAAVVNAMVQGDGAEAAALSGFMKLEGLPNFRAIITSWTSEFWERRTDLSNMEVTHGRSSTATETSSASSLERYEAARSQITEIISRLKTGDLINARRFASQLANTQKKLGDNAYGAKSLTQLAVEARRFGVRSLELEWAKGAVKLAPDDGFAHGVLADTFLNLHRYADSQKSFEQAKALGEEDFATLGQARLFRATNQFQEALAIFEEAKNNFDQHNSHAVHAWFGYCMTLRDLWRTTEAAAAFEKAVNLYPDNVQIRCAYAGALVANGSVLEALEQYQFAIDQLETDSHAICGKARTLGRMGRFDEALALYKEALVTFPEEIAVYVGLSQVYLEKGAPQIALEELQKVKTKFWDDPRMRRAIAIAHKDLGDFDQALSVLDEAVANFPEEASVFDGRARVLQESGHFEDSLQAYDQNVSSFPFDLRAQVGRANLLKLLGRFDSAIETYKEVTTKNPLYPRARVALAAVLVSQNRFNEAEPLLSNGSFRTQDDWVSLHISGMSRLRQGDVHNAQKVFEKGLSETPFSRVRAYFKSARALVEIQRCEYQKAVVVLRDSHDAIPLILLSHSLLQLGRFEEALSQLRAVNDNEPPPVIALRDEIRDRVKSKEIDQSGEDSIYERGAEILLQAA